MVGLVAGVQPCDHLQSVHIGHHHIAHDQVGNLLDGDSQSLDAVTRFADRESPLFQDSPDIRAAMS